MQYSAYQATRRRAPRGARGLKCAHLHDTRRMAHVVPLAGHVD